VKNYAIKKMRPFLLFASYLIFGVPLVQAASFSCEKANTRTEKTVCADDVLAKSANSDTSQFGNLLYEAILHKDTNGVDAALKKGADPNSFGKNSTVIGTPLDWAVTSGSLHIVKLLLDAGADPNRGDRGKYPVYAAVHSNNPRILELLLARGASPNIDTGQPNKDAPLHRAATCFDPPEKYSKCAGAMKALLDAGAKVNEPGVNGLPPISVAIISNRQDLVSLLLVAGADVNQRNDFGQTPLIIAVDQYTLQQVSPKGRVSYLPLIELLLAHGADPNLTDGSKYDAYQDSRRVPYSHGYTVLGVAARHGFTSLAKTLLEHGSDPQIPRADGRRPADIAKENGHKETEQLIRRYKVH